MPNEYSNGIFTSEKRESSVCVCVTISQASLARSTRPQVSLLSEIKKTHTSP